MSYKKYELLYDNEFIAGFDHVIFLKKFIQNDISINNRNESNYRLYEKFFTPAFYNGHPCKPNIEYREIELYDLE